MEFEPVERDKWGGWTHSQLPDLGENVKTCDLNSWADSQGIKITTVYMEDEVDADDPLFEDFFAGAASFLNWQPMPPTQDHFMLSIHDTEDGPCVWWAVKIQKEVEFIPNERGLNFVY